MPRVINIKLTRTIINAARPTVCHLFMYIRETIHLSSMSLNQSLRALSYAVTSLDGTLSVTIIRLRWSGNIVRNNGCVSRAREPPRSPFPATPRLTSRPQHLYRYLISGPPSPNTRHFWSKSYIKFRLYFDAGVCVYACVWGIAGFVSERKDTECPFSRVAGHRI